MKLLKDMKLLKALAYDFCGPEDNYSAVNRDLTELCAELEHVDEILRLCSICTMRNICDKHREARRKWLNRRGKA